MWLASSVVCALTLESARMTGCRFKPRQRVDSQYSIFLLEQHFFAELICEMVK